MKRQSQIAQQYGRILFDSPHKEKVIKDVIKLHEVLTQLRLEWRQLANPTMPTHLQEKILDKLGTALKLDKVLLNFLRVVSQNRRLQELESMLVAFQTCHQEAQGKVEGVVQSVLPLDQKELKTLELGLKKWLKKEVLLRQEIREEILGGIVVQVGTLKVDASLKTRLAHLQHAIKGEGL